MSGATPMVVDVAGYLSQLNFYRPRVTLADESQVNMEWGVAGIPYNVEPGNWSGGFAMAIPFGAENPDGAWEFIKCATSPEGQASWSRDTFAIPTNQESASSPELVADPLWTTVMGVMEDSRGSTYVPGYPNFTEQVNTRLPQVWTGELTAQEAMDQAQEEINSTIEQSGEGG
jgi:multiple sugar transport system substrate-binding protein